MYWTVSRSPSSLSFIRAGPACAVPRRMNLDQAASLTRPVGSDGSEKSFQHFIDGAFVASADGKAFENRRPHDGSLIGHVAEGGRAEVDADRKSTRLTSSQSCATSMPST